MSPGTCIQSSLGSTQTARAQEALALSDPRSSAGMVQKIIKHSQLPVLMHSKQVLQMHQRLFQRHGNHAGGTALAAAEQEEARPERAATS